MMLIIEGTLSLRQYVEQTLGLRQPEPCVDGTRCKMIKLMCHVPDVWHKSTRYNNAFEIMTRSELAFAPEL